MRLLLVLLAVIALGVVEAPRAVAHEADYYLLDKPPKVLGGVRVYAEIEALWIERDRTNNTHVSYFDPPPLFGPDRRSVIETDDVIDDDEEIGGRVAFGLRFDEASALEIVGMAWGHERSETVRDIGGDRLEPVFAPSSLPNNAVPNFRQAEIHDLEFDSELYGAQLNYRHTLDVGSAHVRLLAGLGSFRLTEDLTFNTVGEIPATAADLGRYKVETRNTLYGGQVGLDARVPLGLDWLGLELFGSAGGYANQAKSIIQLFDAQAGPAGSVRQSREEWNPAGIFELAAFLRVRLHRGVWLSGGYRGTYLLGVALAPDQLARSGQVSDFFGNAFDDDGHTLFHGPSVKLGVEF